MAANDNNEGPLGPRARSLNKDIANLPVAERRKVLLGYLDNFFESFVGGVVQATWEENLKDLLSTAAKGETRDEKASLALFKLAGMDVSAMKDPPHLTPHFNLPLDNVFFKDLKPEDIRDLKGWKSVHYRARAHDYSVALTGLTPDEIQSNIDSGNGGWRTVQVSFNALVGYEKGRRENAEFYPALEDRTPFLPAERPIETREKGPRAKRTPRRHMPRG